jgi:hypothetical protein
MDSSVVSRLQSPEIPFFGICGLDKAGIRSSVKRYLILPTTVWERRRNPIRIPEMNARVPVLVLTTFKDAGMP